MRLHSILVAGLLLTPVAALAQDATPVQPGGAAASPSLSPMVPMPREEAGVSGYRVLAITAGTVVGLIAANYLTGGLITPILVAGTGTAMDPALMMATPMVAPAAGAAAVDVAAAGAAPAAAAAAAPAAAAAAAPAAAAAAVEVAAVPAAAAVAAPAAAAAAPAAVEVAAAAPAAAAAAPAAAPGMVASVATPVVASVSYGYGAAQAAVLAAGAIVGGAVGNWLYNR